MLSGWKVGDIRKTLDYQGFQHSLYGDPDWVRTSDPHPVKMVLSQLSYRIMGYVCNLKHLMYSLNGGPCRTRTYDQSVMSRPL